MTSPTVILALPAMSLDLATRRRIVEAHLHALRADVLETQRTIAAVERELRDIDDAMEAEEES